jgi:hypothetical protein
MCVLSGWNRMVILLSDLILAVKTLNFLERKILGKVEEGRIAKIDSLKGIRGKIN